MATIQVNLEDNEYEILKEFKNPGKWEDWRKLNKKCRYVLQRMIVGLPGGHKYVMEIAKEASHNLGNCKWCNHPPTGVNLNRPQTFEEISKQVFGT